ncbi:MAG: spore germination protein, partial [Oscillospiraceae bacterium]
MFEFAKNKTSPRPPQIITDLTCSLEENLSILKALLSNSTDLLTREIDVCGIKVAAIMCEGMVNSQAYAQLIATPLTKLELQNATSDTLSEWVRHKAIFSTDQKEFTTFNELFAFIMSGFVVILIDGINHGTACGLQGYQFRSVGEPSSETNIRGSREGFVEPIRINQSLIRRRIKSPTLKFELFPIGDKSRTDISLVYLTDTASPELLKEVKYRLSKVSPDVILNAGYIQPFLEYGPPSLFSNVSVTERPDTLCAKINEGRIGILVDGTPFALIVPYFFNEHFQSMDDYAYRPYFATFIRCLKYIAFFIAFLLPGLYVAIVTYHPSLLPPVLLMNIAVAEQSAPFPLFIEALLIHLVYEVMR